MVWRSTAPLLQQRFRTLGRVTTAITSMFHDTCHKWQTDSWLWSRPYRRVIGHSWREKKENAALFLVGLEGGELKAMLVEQVLECRASQLADTPLVFIRPSCTVFLSICTHFYSKCLSWLGASEANWQIDCDKYAVVWMVRRGQCKDTQPLNLARDGIFIHLVS